MAREVGERFPRPRLCPIGRSPAFLGEPCHFHLSLLGILVALPCT